MLTVNRGMTRRNTHGGYSGFAASGRNRGIVAGAAALAYIALSLGGMFCRDAASKLSPTHLLVTQASAPTAAVEARPVGGIMFTLPPPQRRAMSGVRASRCLVSGAASYAIPPDECRTVLPMWWSRNQKKVHLADTSEIFVVFSLNFLMVKES